MLMLGVDPRANAFLVWGKGEAKALAPPGSDGSILSGSFVELLPGVSKNQFGRFGDGYVVMLTADAWKKLKSAASGRIGFSLSSTGEGDLKQFAISQPKSSYHNPVYRLNYQAEQGWVEYSSDEPRPKSTGPVVVDKAVYQWLGAVKAPSTKGPIRFQIVLPLWPR